MAKEVLKNTKKDKPQLWKPGQSGNPKGRPTNPDRKEALEILTAAAPKVAEKALSMVLCKDPDTTVLNALIKKIFPDNIKVEGQLAINTLAGIKLMLEK